MGQRIKMKVKELLQTLQNFHPEKEVIMEGDGYFMRIYSVGLKNNYVFLSRHYELQEKKND